MIIEIFKNTNFGNNDLVWNVPHPEYDYSVHESKVFNNVNMRFPLLTTRIVVQGEYNFDTAFYDYMIITNDDESKTYYFIKTIVAERNILIFSVTLDVITTHNILSQPVSGVIVRKHDTNLRETKFDYPTALAFEGNYNREFYTYVGYTAPVTRLIESTVNLSKVDSSISIPSNDGSNIVVPRLPKPSHTTEYVVTSWSSNLTPDNSTAYTLYLNDQVNETVLNTVRGLSGDGAISDSYTIPTEAVSIVNNGAEVQKITGKMITRISPLKLEIDFENDFENPDKWVPKNEAIKGMFSVAITSMQEKTRITFPAWDLQNSVDENGNIKVNLWCDPKPSGAPYCCPDQVVSLYPKENGGIINLATLEVKSVRGGQWLRNPLIYSTARGEIFSTIETQLQRERADYEKRVALHELELSKRERDIRIAQADYNYQSGLASSVISGGASLFSGDFSGAFTQAKGVLDSTINQQFTQQMRDLQAYEQEAEKTLINMAYSNNLKNLNVQENIRRVVPREAVFEPNESLGSFQQYNGFTLSLVVPDIESLKAKDMEYSKYGYPVYEAVTDFVMLDNLRENHTVYQFESPLVEIGGQNGDMVRAVLQSGIRILSKQYTRENILNNPKTGKLPPTEIIIPLDGRYYWTQTSGSTSTYKVFVTEGINYEGIEGIEEDSKLYKFDGTEIPNVYGNFDAPDQGTMFDWGLVGISVANEICGFGPDYNPEEDEIRAFFYGYRMLNNNTWQPYNGVGDKAWGKIDKNGDLIPSSVSRDLPTTLNEEGGYLPYRIITPIPQTLIKMNKEEMVNEKL